MPNMNETTAMTPFIMPEMMESGFDATDLGEDFEGLQLSLKKLKIPAGGVLQFEEPGSDPEVPDYIKNIEGIILHNHASNAFWIAGAEYDENSTPLCSSFDGKCGYGTPGGTCATCEMNQYGTDQSGGKGKACKNMRTLYILRSGEAMPIQLSLPPTSLRPFNDFISAVFATRQRPTWASIIQIGLRRIENGSNLYSVATFRKVRDLTVEEIVQMRSYVTGFRAQIKDTLQTRTIEAMNRSADDDLGDSAVDTTGTVDDEHFAVTSPDVINGDADALPM